MAKYISICRVGEKFINRGDPIMLLQPMIILYPEVRSVTLKATDLSGATFVVNRGKTMIAAYMTRTKQGTVKPLLVRVRPHEAPVTLQSSQVFLNNTDGDAALSDWLEAGIDQLLED